MPTTTTARTAKHGEKMIEIRIRFFTDDIAGDKNKIQQKEAWDTGVVDMRANTAHEITPAAPKPFNSILDLQSTIAEVLTDHGITLHANSKLRKLVKP